MKAKIIITLIIFLFLNFLDYILTLKATSCGAIEANPLMRMLLEDITAFSMVKLALPAFVTLLAVYVVSKAELKEGTRTYKACRILSSFVVVIYIVVITNNIIGIASAEDVEEISLNDTFFYSESGVTYLAKKTNSEKWDTRHWLGDYWADLNKLTIDFDTYPDVSSLDLYVNTRYKWERWKSGQVVESEEYNYWGLARYNISSGERIVIDENCGASHSEFYLKYGDTYVGRISMFVYPRPSEGTGRYLMYIRFTDLNYTYIENVGSGVKTYTLEPVTDTIFQVKVIRHSAGSGSEYKYYTIGVVGNERSFLVGKDNNCYLREYQDATVTYSFTIRNDYSYYYYCDYAGTEYSWLNVTKLEGYTKWEVKYKSIFEGGTEVYTWSESDFNKNSFSKKFYGYIIEAKVYYQTGNQTIGFPLPEAEGVTTGEDIKQVTLMFVNNESQELLDNVHVVAEVYKDGLLIQQIDDIFHNRMVIEVPNGSQLIVYKAEREGFRSELEDTGGSLYLFIHNDTTVVLQFYPTVTEANLHFWFFDTNQNALIPGVNFTLSCEGNIIDSGTYDYEKEYTVERWKTYYWYASKTGYFNASGEIYISSEYDTYTVYVELVPIEPIQPEDNNTIVSFLVKNDLGYPISGAAVTMVGITKITNQQGYTYFKVAKNGTYNYVVQAKDYESISGTIKVGIDPVMVTVTPYPAVSPTPSTPGGETTPGGGTGGFTPPSTLEEGINALYTNAGTLINLAILVTIVQFLYMIMPPRGRR